MLLHGAQNGTGGLILQFFGGSADAPTPTRCYRISAMTFGVLMAAVAVITHGWLGISPRGLRGTEAESFDQA